MHNLDWTVRASVFWVPGRSTYRVPQTWGIFGKDHKQLSIYGAVSILLAKSIWANRDNRQGSKQFDSLTRSEAVWQDCDLLHIQVLTELFTEFSGINLKF